jgi:TonB-linked SusC/RagA family outer membrane protein
MKLKLTWLLTLFMAFVMQFSFSQEKTVTGTITTLEDGLPLPGASVVVKGTSRGQQTDFDGNYSINASVGDILVFSYVGMKNTEIAIGSGNTYDVVLELDGALDEVVVVAYGSQSKEKIVQNVSVIGEAALENLVTTSSADQLLQGQASGVQVVSTSGLLGANVNVRVRGINTINGNSAPLFVVDGVVLTDNTNTFGDGGNTGQNPLSFINPNDIESFTVLKDAGATALYGTRGANGVILITTKKGRAGQEATVTVNNFVQFTTVADLFTALTPDEYRGFRTDVRNIQNGTNLGPEDLGLGAFGSGGFDYIDGVSRTGVTKHTDVNLRGGSENTTYFLSGLYEGAESFAVGNDLTRFGIRTNLEHKLNDWLVIGANVGITNTVLNAIGRENNTFAPFTSAFLTNPTVVPFDEDGNYVRSANFIPNIIAVANENTNKTDATRIIGSAYAQVYFTPKLSFRSELGVDRTTSEQNTRNIDIVSAGGSANMLTISDNLYRVTNSLSYANTFGKHSLNLLALQEYEERRRRNTQISGTGFLSDDLLNVGSAATQLVNAASRSGSIITGYLGRISYDFDSKYIFEVSGRVDGSSRFGSNNRYGRFWSLATGWTISKEKFLENADWLDFFSFRGSIGTAGNDRLGGNFPSLALYGTDRYNGIPTANVTQAENVNLGFEQTRTLDIGFRSAYFNNRLTLNVTYFKKNTTDLLFNLPVPRQSGELDQAQNTGELQNAGWEFDLTADIVRGEDFSWSTTLNVTTLENEVIALNSDAALDDQGRRFIETGAQRAIEGLPLSNFFLVRYVGVNSQTGDAEWLDIDGNVTTNPNFDTDRVIVDESALPDFTGGWINNFRYKNWDLSTVMNFAVGNSILVDGLRFIDGIDAIGGTINVRSENLDFWREPGDNAFAPSPASSTANNFNQRSTAQMRDGSFLRLNNITLGYNFPKKLMDKMSIISSVRLYATATNLFTIKGDDLEGIDPENNDSNDPLRQGVSFFTAPQSSTFLLGATIQF